MRLNRELKFEEGDQQKETLWHYTDAAGLLGILTVRELWATHFAFLNDRKELVHGENIFLGQRILSPHSGAIGGEKSPLFLGFLSNLAAQ